jgi:hypothetical protein
LELLRIIISLDDLFEKIILFLYFFIHLLFIEKIYIL